MVDQFKEKPTLDVAKEYVEHGYLWNSGMFMFRTDLFSEQVLLHAPDVYSAFASGTVEESFQKTPRISIDYGVLEKTDCIAVLPLQIEWNDLGSFNAFGSEYDQYKDDHGNISFHEDLFIDSSKNLVYSDKQKITAVIGLDNIVIVDQPDALLICSKDAAQDVKLVVDHLKKLNDKRSENSTIEYCTWGTQEILSSNVAWIFQQFSSVLPTVLVYEKKDTFSEQWTVAQGGVSLLGKGTAREYVAGEKFSLEQKGVFTFKIMASGTELLLLRMNSESISLSSKETR